jgi:hypothetical protein
VYSWLVQVQPWLLSKMQKIQQYYFVSVITIYFQRICFFSTGSASFTVLPFYCSTVILCYCITVLLCYCSTVILCYCTSVRLSVYSWIVQVQPWLLSKMQKIQQYYFVSVNTIYFQTICFFLLALHHSLCYHSTVVLWYCATVLLWYCASVLLWYCATVLLY